MGKMSFKPLEQHFFIFFPDSWDPKPCSPCPMARLWIQRDGLVQIDEIMAVTDEARSHGVVRSPRDPLVIIQVIDSIETY